MIKIEIRTTDAKWAAVNGTPGRDERTVINVATFERVTFAGAQMIRFDIRQVAKRIPTDYQNPFVMYPAKWIVK